MTQNKETLPKGRTESHNGQSQSLQENAKHVNKSGKTVTTKHSDIVDGLLDDDNEFDIQQYQYFLHDTNHEKRNLIHQIVSALKRRKLKAPLKVLELVERLVLDKPDLFTAMDEYDQVPLLRAAQSNVEILFRVIDLVTPEPVLESIRTRCDKSHKTCPLSHVHKSRRVQCSKLKPASQSNTQQRERNGRPETPKAKPAEMDDMSVETPCLHDLVDIEQLVKKDAELKKTLSYALGQSPCLESLIVDSKFDPAQKDDIQKVPLDSFKILLQLCPDTVFERTVQNGYSPLQMAIRLYDKEFIEYDHLSSIIQVLVDRYPSSIYFQAGYDAREDKNKTAYRLLKELKKVNSESNVRSRSRTEELLKRTCIGSPHKDWNAMTESPHEDGNAITESLHKDWNKVIEFLYWDPKCSRQIWLDLSGETLPLNTPYISTIKEQSGMRFETVMDYVKLPYWNSQDRKARDQDFADGYREGIDGDVAKSVDPYTAIFQWLWDSNVRKIFTVEVDDNGPNPHTNAAIRQCFQRTDRKKNPQDFDVEVWKWKKIDICGETILKAAPKAREVHLYSSGNTAVLRGWACSSGLSKLANDKDDENDCKEYQDELKDRLVARCPLLKKEAIKIDYNGHQVTQAARHGKHQDDDRKDGKKPSNAVPKSGQWIEELFHFKQFLNGVLNSREKPSVKVALLDDGSKLTKLFGKQEGESFRPDKEGYFVGPSTHGTEMARCIRNICPMAELYIARLDDSRKVENQKFTTSSAYKALQWAMEMDADIISMSWTFKKRDGYDSDEKAFIELINKAVSAKKFILFGSLPDKGPEARISDYLPVGLDKVIKIGSATIFGQQAKENIYAHPDFLLPGEELETPQGKTVSGSSFSTAYASGLAALVLYCLKAHIELEDPDPVDIRTKRLAIAKTIQGMTKIFKTISIKSAEDKPYFVQPSKTLLDEFGDSVEEKLKAIRRIVSVFLDAASLAALE